MLEVADLACTGPGTPLVAQDGEDRHAGSLTTFFRAEPLEIAMSNDPFGAQTIRLEVRRPKDDEILEVMLVYYDGAQMETVRRKDRLRRAAPPGRHPPPASGTKACAACGPQARQAIAHERVNAARDRSIVRAAAASCLDRRPQPSSEKGAAPFERRAELLIVLSEASRQFGSRPDRTGARIRNDQPPRIRLHVISAPMAPLGKPGLPIHSIPSAAEYSRSGLRQHPRSAAGHKAADLQPH